MENYNKENEYTGVIYCITNKINEKQYIGQALSYLYNKGKLKRHGAIGRFAVHLNSALKGKEYCPKLYASIRKYGKENFSEKILIITAIELLDQVEEYYIKKFDSVKKGYNIMHGGSNCNRSIDYRKTRIQRIKESMIKRWKDPDYINKTVPANLLAVIKRANEGKTRKINKDLPANIYKSDKGYDIRIMRNGKYKITSIEGKNLSNEEKLNLAIKKRDEILLNIKNGIDNSLQKKVDHNNNKLPKNIVTYQARGNEGYKVIIRYKNKRREKTFTDGSLTMDQKLELAKIALTHMTENKINLINNEKTKRLDHIGNQLPSYIGICTKKGKIIGYKIHYKNISKCFCIGSKSMDQKLKEAKEYLIQIMGNPQVNS